MRTLQLILCLIAGVSASNYIANDVVDNYAHVKELLGQFYRRSARRFGNDYNPATILKASEKIGDDGTEATVNRHIWEDVFENDIILTVPQAESLLAEKSSFGRGRRQAQPTAFSFWPNLTIPYEFSVQDATWQNLIRSALRHIEQNTCVRFEENGAGRDGLRYFRGSGCWSNVGRIGGRQQVSIGYGCENAGIIAHETLHALGLWHEQSRDDRDNYVSMNMNWIIRGTEGNFEKRTPANSDNLGQPYDLGSVMHYGAKSFTTDWSINTILTKDAKFQNTIGQRDGLSFKDAKMINLRYCENVCELKLPCQNDGYTDPNNCRRCKCTKGYGGTHCERVEPTSCGGELIASSSYQKLESQPVYANTNCVWRIKSPAGEKIEMTVDSVSFPCLDACPSFVEVKSTKNKIATGARLCCDAPAGSIYSEDDDIILIMRGGPNLQNGYLGFSVKYRTYGAPTLTTTYRPATTTATTTTTTTTTTRPTTRSSTTTRATTPYSRATTTTRPPTTTFPRYANGRWGVWGSWSRCNRECGGCGTRQRVRGCYGGNGYCSGYAVQTESCNQQACGGNRPSSAICQGRILLPCDLINKLEFGQKRTARSPDCARWNSGVQRTDTRSVSQSFYRHPVEKRRNNRRNRRAAAAPAPMCEKKFSYQCPTSMLSIHIDWKAAGYPATEDSLPIQRDEVQSCCAGYYLSRGFCYKS